MIEEFLAGEEASLFALCDGNERAAFGTAQDHKRAFDGDRGPEHGRHGRLLAGPDARRRRSSSAMREIVRPTFAGMAAEGAPFKGFLFAA